MYPIYVNPGGWNKRHFVEIFVYDKVTCYFFIFNVFQRNKIYKCGKVWIFVRKKTVKKYFRIVLQKKTWNKFFSATHSCSFFLTHFHLWLIIKKMPTRLSQRCIDYEVTSTASSASKLPEEFSIDGQQFVGIYLAFCLSCFTLRNIKK